MSKKHYPSGTGMTPSRTELGKFLRARRLELGLSQVQVVELAGLRQKFYSLLEIGIKHYPEAKKLKGLAKALKCEFSQLQSLVPARRQTKFKPKTDLRKVGPRTKPTNSALGQLVRSRRQELKLSQSKLAGKLGVKRQFVSQVELGRCYLSNNEMIKRFAKALKLKTANLLMLRPQRKLKEIKMAGMKPATVGEFLASRRGKLGMTQEKLAGYVGISESVISVIEKSRRIPRPQILDKLEEVLKCEIPTELFFRL